MVSSIIEGIRNYIASVPLMSEFDSKHRHIDWTDADNDNYGIFPDTDNLVDEYVDGTQIRQYICQINIRKFAFLERLQRWFDAAADAGDLPDMPDGCTAIEITAENAMLMELDPSGKRGTYAIQIKLKYEKEE